MKCVRCGSEMDPNARACVKCGAINYNHPANQEFARKYGNKNEKTEANPELLKNNVGLLPKIILAIMVIVLIVIVLYLTKVI